MPDRSGQQFGDYQLKKRIAKGGFSEVYLAEHVGRETQVALKLLRASLTQERFTLPSSARRAFSVSETTPISCISSITESNR
ncbi:hypothetical protein [Dictyobacter formicarum]|uniref:Protein kinase domain-containing protein n=1 Tax=Dictyobacter formicarum TaxID=2778368 RepID=A0ABQ3VV25_9CHLR|nr:hypothetical protein [Dictyobacter formicarum]GHO89156.1 hypothetical protein KSZ_71620 [Dictyobacter formicarum]